MKRSCTSISVHNGRFGVGSILCVKHKKQMKNMLVYFCCNINVTNEIKNWFLLTFSHMEYNLAEYVDMKHDINRKPFIKNGVLLKVLMPLSKT